MIQTLDDLYKKDSSDVKAILSIRDKLNEVITHINSNKKETKPTISWSEVLQNPSKSLSMIWELAKIADKLGYEYILWGDRIYKLNRQDSNFYDTNLTIKDLK